MQRENKWQDIEGEKDIRKLSKDMFNELVLPNLQEYQANRNFIIDQIIFMAKTEERADIQSEINRAVAEERETLIKELTKRAEQSGGERFQTFVEVLAILNK